MKNMLKKLSASMTRTCESYGMTYNLYSGFGFPTVSYEF